MGIGRRRGAEKMGNEGKGKERERKKSEELS